MGFSTSWSHSQTPAGCAIIQLNSTTIHQDSVRSHMLRTQSYKMAPNFRCQSQVQVVTCASDGCRLEVPTTPSLDLINLLEGLTELKETSNQNTGLLSIFTTQGQPSGRDAHSREWGRAQSCHATSRGSTLPASACVPQP